MKNFLRFVITLLGLLVGPVLVLSAQALIKLFSGLDIYALLPEAAVFGIFAVSALLSGVLFFFLSRVIAERWMESFSLLEKALAHMRPGAMALGLLGLILGLVLAGCCSMIINRIPATWIAIPLDIAVFALFGYLGLRYGIKNADRFIHAMKEGWGRRKNKEESGEEPDSGVSPKILDTSAIIDGRIFDVLNTGFVEGTLIIPEFVLDELRHIADSQDGFKRSKGRRGLDVIRRIQKELHLPVEICTTDYEDVAEVDGKLLRLARERKAKIFTNDFNLNKVATVQGVAVLNINELSNAVKPALLPGEELTVTVLKEGKEADQGVAYLPDGTMIVVENGRKAIGETVLVSVTSVLQTPAGRMIFARVQ